MHYTSSPADFLSPPSRYQFDQDLLARTLSSLTPATAIVFLGSKQLEHPQDVVQLGHTPLIVPPSLSKTEPIYGTIYEVVHVHVLVHLKILYTKYTMYFYLHL